MEIKDLSWTSSLNRHNHELLPKSIRGVIVGKSGCGKTTLLTNLLTRPGWLDYNQLHVYGKSLFQPEYKILRRAYDLGLSKKDIVAVYQNRDEIVKSGCEPLEVMEAMARERKRGKQDCPITCQFYESASDIPDPSELESGDKNLMIFDDVILEPQNRCEKYYLRGRHSNVDCFYLSQNYFKLPRQTIRENANLFCLFPQDNKNINHIYNDHVSSDMSKEDFKKLCEKSWEQPHGFVTIDLSSHKCNGKYRKGLGEFYIP